MQNTFIVLAHICLKLCIDLIFNILVFVSTLLGGPNPHDPEPRFDIFQRAINFLIKLK